MTIIIRNDYQKWKTFKHLACQTPVKNSRSNKKIGNKLW